MAAKIVSGGGKGGGGKAIGGGTSAKGRGKSSMAMDSDGWNRGKRYA